MISLPVMKGSTITLPKESASTSPRADFLSARQPGDAEGATLTGRLDDHPIPQYRPNLPHSFVNGGARQQQHVIGNRQAEAPKQRLGAGFVHGQGAGLDATSDIGQAEDVQQALHPAILSRRPVQSGKHRVRVQLRQADRCLGSNSNKVARCPAASSPAATCRAETRETSASKDWPPINTTMLQTLNGMFAGATLTNHQAAPCAMQCF